MKLGNGVCGCSRERGRCVDGGRSNYFSSRRRNGLAENGIYEKRAKPGPWKGLGWEGTR